MVPICTSRLLHKFCDSIAFFWLTYRFTNMAKRYSAYEISEAMSDLSDTARRVARIWKRGGYFERVRSVQTTLTRIFIALESVSHGLHEN